MPANLPPQYYELEREFKNEQDPAEKLRLAQELLAMMPKHKGTDKLQAEMKAKIAKLKEQVEGGGQKKHGARQAVAPDSIEREGAGLVILIGPPNSGKSSLLDYLTNSKPLIADYPYTTREPMTGMMPFETIQLQLVDTPAISDEQMENYMPNLIRQGDLIVLVADTSLDNPLADLKSLITRLEEKRIILAPQIPEKNDDPRNTYKKTVIAAHKCHEDNGPAGLEIMQKEFPNFKIIPTSILDDEAMNNFKRELFAALEVIRVYTKPVGKEADFKDPVILPRGGTVADAAMHLHKDFAHKLQFAKVWGHGKFEGQRVKATYILSDGDVVEFHI